MVRFPEAEARLFGNKFVCRKCKTKIRTSMAKVLQRKVTCKRCGSKSFRPIRKKK